MEKIHGNMHIFVLSCIIMGKGLLALYLGCGCPLDEVNTNHEECLDQIVITITINTTTSDSTYLVLFQHCLGVIVGCVFHPLSN